MMEYFKLSFLIFLCQYFKGWVSNLMEYFKLLTKFFNYKRVLRADYFKILPDEITLEILSRLPVESAINCKLVCSNWKSLVSHPSFSKLHFHHLNDSADVSGKLGFLALIGNEIKTSYYFEYELNHDEWTTPIQRIRRISFTPPYKNFRFIGSCNGLVCVTEGRSICIFNPITKEYVVLPEIKKYEWYGSSFGYAASTNEYKVVVGKYQLKPDSVAVHIYTLGSGNGWRHLGDLNFKCNAYDWDEPGIFVNGAIYWVSFALEKIITFDLAEEFFCEDLSLPLLPPENRWYTNRIGVLNGCLSFAIGQNIEEARYFDIWLLKKRDDNHDKKVGEEHQSLGWSKGVRIDRSRFLAITKSDGVLTYDVNYLKIYDTKTSSSKRLVKFKNCLLQVYPHMNSLVSLKELGEEDTKIMESVEVEDPRPCDYPFKQLKKDGTPEYLFL